MVNAYAKAFSLNKKKKKFNSGISGGVKSNDSAKNLHRLEDHNKLNNRFSAQLYNMLFLYNI